MLQIIIGGDVCPMGQVEKEFIDGNAFAIFHDLLNEINNTDLSIVNLECPLISHETPILKAGPVLGAKTECINGFLNSGWEVLNLANNHSFDHGITGLHETIKTISNVGLNRIGAGLNIVDAQQPYITYIKKRRIVIYSMAEREFSVADEYCSGANPFDIINFTNAIRLYKKRGIFIVLIHGGKEFYQYPTPELMRICHFIIDMGADAVICSHTHCPLPWEIYKGKPIIYGLGNLVFEPFSKQSSSWYEGYLAKLIIDDQNIKFSPVPYFQSKSQNGAFKMDSTSQNEFLDEMHKKCTQISNINFVYEEWLKYCDVQRNVYLSELFGYNTIMRKFKNILIPLFHSKGSILKSLLLTQCETHREILETIFRQERQNLSK